MILLLLLASALDTDGRLAFKNEEEEEGELLTLPEDGLPPFMAATMAFGVEGRLCCC